MKEFMSAETTIPIYAKQVDPAVEELCHSWWSCQMAGVVSDGWYLMTASVLAVIVIAAMAYLQTARSVLEEERSRTAAERNAFLTFARRIAELSADSSPAPELASGGVVAIRTTTQRASGSLEQVRTSYRETVMAVSHYDEDYEESLIEHMAVEFGEDVAVAVQNGPHLTPQLQHALISKATQAAAERARLMDALEREAESISRAEETFTAIERELDEYQPEQLRSVSYRTLSARWTELDPLEDRCSKVLQARQERLRNEPMNQDVPEQAPSLFEYLYHSLGVDFPVLATGTTLLERIQESRRYVTRSAVRRA